MLPHPLSPRHPLKACRLSFPPFRTISTSLASPPSRATLRPPSTLYLPVSSSLLGLTLWRDPSPLWRTHLHSGLGPSSPQGFHSAVWGHHPHPHSPGSSSRSQDHSSHPGQALYPPGATFHPGSKPFHIPTKDFFYHFFFLTICKWEFSFTLQWLFYTYSFF